MIHVCEHCGSPSTPGQCAHCGQSLTNPKLGAGALLLGLGLTIGLSGCEGPFVGEAEYGVPDTGYLDADGDDYPERSDCDDDNPDIYPGAPETPGDGVDSNCDGEDDT